jgi:hypothetical protein
MGQIEELQKKQILPADISTDLNWVRLRANASIHRRETTSIKSEEYSGPRKLDHPVSY